MQLHRLCSPPLLLLLLLLLLLPDARRLWVAERSCPEILAWSSADGGGGERWRCDETVDEVCAQIEEQMSILNLLSSDEGTSEEEHLRLSMVQLDVERSKWLLRAFLRTRLHKLESYAMHYSSLAPTRRSQLLSPLEQAYLTKYTSIQHAHFSSSVLDYLPEPLRSLTDGSEDAGVEGEGAANRGSGAKGGMVPRPDMGAPVFIRCGEDCGEVRTEDGESANLSRGSVHILTYGSVRTLVLQGRVELL
ncbi:hypothetical protein BCV69DRAFT_292907 [Microstroma glucosiphilum]|uniref:DNA replication complex GINS protein SLD5 n=1 Tax=Pseudomicrostroma glucosiphilum TaxID=1684307 RepID=A0A316UC71_9BASI|nr:hypothetical protein BCV69DRAFT_292907 [Pseudomicrostroma glucosiphilum]PWN22468.1 hypothetical protein BCV69DRAFT_292907 [Pseudomicrostroma glucosiphilum]